MKLALYLVISISLVINSLTLMSLGMWIYSNDFFFLNIGILLSLAVILFFLKIEKMQNDPFFK